MKNKITTIEKKINGVNFPEKTGDTIDSCIKAINKSCLKKF